MKTNNKIIINVPKNSKIIIQIIHGAMEHINRYKDFIAKLNKENIGVVTRSLSGSDNDLLRSNDSLNLYHSFSKEDIYEGISEVTKIIKKKFPNHKHLILGHSLGSFVAKNFYFNNEFKYDGLILLGTNDFSTLKYNLGKWFTIGIKDSKISKWGNWVIFNQNAFMSKTKNKDSNWISTDQDNYNRYLNDEKCGNLFDGKSLKAVIKILGDNQKINYKKFENKEKPILILGGLEDPVSNFGKELTKYENKLNKFEFKNVTMKIYSNSKHEILFDLEKKVVLDNILNFIKISFENII